MAGGAQFESGLRPSGRDRFVTCLQFAAGLMIAHLIAGKAARDGLQTGAAQ